MIKTAQPTAFRLVRIKDTFQLQNKTPTSQLADRQVGWEHGQSSMKNSWLGKQREKLGQRGHRGCVVHSPLLLKEMILLMWALTGPEWVCLSPQVWMHNGVSPSAVVTFVLSENWLTKHERIQTTVWWIYQTTQFTFENDTQRRHLFRKAKTTGNQLNSYVFSFEWRTSN